jgi:hypothetical protein
MITLRRMGWLTLALTSAACSSPDLVFRVDAGGAVGGVGGVGGNGSVDAGAPVSLDGFVAAPTDGGSCANGPAGVVAVIPAETMAPGTACLTCHLATNAGFLYIAGTVYRDYHEPDLCLGVTGVQVKVEDAQGSVHMLDVDSSGNFLDNSVSALYPTPWTVAVVSGSQSRAMVGTVTSGDCNSCHTASGANAAPGRIIAPTATGAAR